MLCEAWKQYCLQYGLGKANISISSGYRNPALNKAVGGSSTSAHCYGYAFDLIPSNGQMMAFKRFCRAYLADRTFDQLISREENSKGVPSWMHVSYKHPDGQQRRQFLSMVNGKYFPFRDTDSDR